MNLLLLSRYGDLGASSRIRSYQYISYLQSNGIDVIVSPLLGNKYLTKLYSGKRARITEILASYIRRIAVICSDEHFDVVWFEKELFPWLPAFFEQLIDRMRVPYIVDYDDAVFHRYDQHKSAFVRSIFGSKIDRIMAAATLVTAGNEYLAEKARQAGASRVEIVPTVVDISRYPVVQPHSHEQFTIGWIGSPSTKKYLEAVRPALAQLCQDNRGRVVLVGADVDWPEIPVVLRPWTEATEVDDIMQFDVGIMPLDDGLWEHGKCGYKLIQYMACGKPVVGSPVGVNREIIIEGVNGFTATTTAEWVTALNRLCVNKETCHDFGRKGRELVEQRYALHVTAPRLLELMQFVASTGSVKALP